MGPEGSPTNAIVFKDTSQTHSFSTTHSGEGRISPWDSRIHQGTDTPHTSSFWLSPRHPPLQTTSYRPGSRIHLYPTCSDSPRYPLEDKAAFESVPALTVRGSCRARPQGRALLQSVEGQQQGAENQNTLSDEATATFSELFGCESTL